MIKTLIAIAFLGPLLAGCGAVPWNKQNYAGIEAWHVGYEETASGGTEISEVSYINGKELGASEIRIRLADGTVLNFAGDQITAFRGQEIRGDVERVIAERIGDVAPGLVDAIIDAITGGATSLAPDG